MVGDESILSLRMRGQLDKAGTQIHSNSRRSQ
jgi:hypothetical protein